LNNTKLIETAINSCGFICIPEIQSLPDLTGIVPVIKILQKPALIKFDSCTTVSKTGSIVDFVVKKGSQELLVGVWPNGYHLTDDQMQRIEKAGKSYVAILGEWIDSDNVTQALETGRITVDKFDIGTAELQIFYWVYHARHGWYYDREKNEVRI